jgi:hypothetical protein
MQQTTVQKKRASLVRTMAVVMRKCLNQERLKCSLSCLAFSFPTKKKKGHRRGDVQFRVRIKVTSTCWVRVRVKEESRRFSDFPKSISRSEPPECCTSEMLATTRSRFLQLKARLELSLPVSRVVKGQERGLLCPVHSFPHRALRPGTERLDHSHACPLWAAFPSSAYVLPLV